MRNHWRRKILALLYLSDTTAAVSAFFIAYFLRNAGPFQLALEAIQPIRIYLTALPIATSLLLAVFYLSGLYRPTTRKEHFNELYTVTRATTIWTLLIMAGSYLYKYDYSRIIVTLLYLFTLLLVNLGRSLIRFIEIRNYQEGRGVVKILIIGAGRPGRALARKLKSYTSIGYTIIGFLDGNTTNRKGFPIIGTLDTIVKIISEKQIDEVYVADPTLSHETILDLMAQCSHTDTRFKITSNTFNLIRGDTDIAKLESIPSLELWRIRENWWVGTSKRLFDITLTFLLLPIIAPLWILTATAIYLADGRPIVLTQKRVGLHGKIFDMLKFRTMHKNSSKYADSPQIGEDLRITPIGRILRKTSLDELPQFINILKGEMSLVGPRPEMPQKVEKYKHWQRMRLEVKPGLTGLWQILGRKDLPLEENLEYDFFYINNQSFLLDLVILLKTIPAVLSGKGAY